MSLAAKLPYDHPYANGFGYGGQTIPTDTDAVAYLGNVASEDGAGVEVGVANAISNFIVGCKADGIWDAIKASCILAGARTLAGALVPLVGAAPTNNNFVDADYNRETGLVGNGSTKYLDSNRANNAHPQDDVHQSVYVASVNTLADAFIGGVDRSTPESGTFIVVRNTGTILARANASVNNETGFVFSGSGFVGISRSSSDSQTLRADGVDIVDSVSSSFLNTRSNYVFARDDADATLDHSGARLAFYSIGESLDLAAFDARVTALIQEIALHFSTGLSLAGFEPETVQYLTDGYDNGGSLQ